MKKKTNISDKALKIINGAKIKPIPKWEFIVKNWGLWLGLVVSLGLLVLGSSLSWFGVIDKIITPYLWQLIVIIFLGISFLLFEQTKRAYRFQKWQVALIIIIGGLIFGGALFKIGLASRIDRNFESRFSFYRQMVPMKMMVWNNPESGYLSGVIVKIISVGDFVIRDVDNNSWTITGTNPIVRGRVKMIIGEEVKLIGTQTGTNSFTVDEIRPWNGMGQNMMKENY